MPALRSLLNLLCPQFRGQDFIVSGGGFANPPAGHRREVVGDGERFRGIAQPASSGDHTLIPPLRLLRFAPNPLSDPHPQLSLVANGLGRCDFLSRGNLLGPQSNGDW